MSQPAFIPDFSEGLETGLYLALLELIDEGLIITGDEVILEANSAACRLLERDYRDIAGQPLETLFPSGKAFLEARERLLVQGEMRGSLQVALPGGRKRVLRFIAAARLRPGIHAIIISPDTVPEPKPAEGTKAAAERTDTLWPRLAAALEQPVLVVDAHGSLRAVNAAAVHALGTSREALLGHDVSEHLSIDWPAEGEAPVAQVSLRAQTGGDTMRTRVLEGPRQGWRTLILPARARDTAREARTSPPAASGQPATLGMLRKAIERGQLELHFQPLIDARGNRVVGGEALLRWNHPGSGQLPYHRFAELAREGGLLPDMARWSLSRAIAEASQWPGEDTVLTINLSPEQARTPGLAAHLQATLEAMSLPPQRLELDFDEALFANPDDVAILHAVEALGIRIAIDDFGRGAFPLPALRRHPVHAIKLTPALVRGVGYNEDSEAVVEAICRMAEVLGLDVLARGVETQAQQAFLLALGCHLQQGPLFGPPLPGDTFSAFLPPSGSLQPDF